MSSIRILTGVNSSWIFLISVFIVFLASFDVVLVSGQCLDGQRSLLLQLKDGLVFDSTISTRLVNWNPDEDCCSWNGVGCDTSGRVITLELNEESISGGIENSTSLFSFQYLQKLNLAFNSFSSIPIPSGISNLKNLVHLNLSAAGFEGQIPIELANLTKLVYLDLSAQSLNLENPNLKKLIQNLQNLEELYLDGVDISAQRSEWCQALSSSLPRLKVLSLRGCQISGPIDTSLSELRSLSVIQLDRNDLLTTVPDFFATFPNLTTLTLSSCNLNGTFPGNISQVSTLQNLDLSFNYLLHGSLQQLPDNGSLRTIVLSKTSFSGTIASSLSNLRNLSRIELSDCTFGGPIPPMENLEELVYIDFSSNNFSGPMPSFRKCKYLTNIDLSRNSLTDSLSSAHFEGLSNLVILNLGFNTLDGSIPSSIFALPSLKWLDLSHNKLSGQIDEFPNASASLLEGLDLSYNRFNGTIPRFFFELKALYTISLSSNLFTGIPRVETIKSLQNLTFVDLSENHMKGEIPNWIWSFGDGNSPFVNLSFNLLVGLQKPYQFPVQLSGLDLHANHLQGEIPIPPASVIYVDYSSNNFSGSIPPDIGNNISRTTFFSLSNNTLTGSIPESICNATNLQLLDFSDNALTGKIPSCLVENITMGVLNLARNNLTGSITDTFPDNCNLETLDLSKNALEGKIPKSLINCPYLKVLHIGNNKIEDTFPCSLKNLSSLHVLVLRSNKLYGDVNCPGANNSWPKLQTIDIAYNNFSGVLTPDYFSGWTKMMLDNDDATIPRDPVTFNLWRQFYYQNQVSVTVKGLEMELVNILNIFSSIDFSNNKFTGEIPETIGDLKSLYDLILSHNAFSGRIPSSITKLTSLRSLDLSVNQLTGEIPETLAKLYCLSRFNLSFNKLSGRIPRGQLGTFTSASYEENAGLCGSPLNTTCNSSNEDRDMPSPSKYEIKWEYLSATGGFIFGLSTFTWVLLLCHSWREKYFYYVDKLLVKFVNIKGGGSISEHWFRNQQNRRL